MKQLILTTVACSLLLGVVYGATATQALTERPLAVLGVLLIGIGLVRHHREANRPAAVRVRSGQPRR